MSPDVRYTSVVVGSDFLVKDRRSGLFLGIDETADRLNRLEAQRDDLLAACEALLTYLDVARPGPDRPPYEALAAARAAIVKAKGGGL